MKLLISRITYLISILKIAKEIYMDQNGGYLKYKIDLQELIVKHSGKSWDEHMANRGTRKREFVTARKVHIALMVDFLGMTWHKSTAVYNKDHATVKNCKKRCKEHLLYDRDFVRQYAEVFDYAIKKKPSLGDVYVINEKIR